MKRFLAGLLAIATLGAGACAREGVYGYCGEGDTCRYDLPEKMLVRTYSGFVEPGSGVFAAVEAPSGARIGVGEGDAVEPAEATSGAVKTAAVGAPAATLVAISN